MPWPENCDIGSLAPSYGSRIGSQQKDNRKQCRFIPKVVRIIEPFLGLLGLDRRVGMVWMTAAVFGNTYGGALIVAESRERRLLPELLRTLHVSIGINHAMVEDPSLFIPLGINPV